VKNLYLKTMAFLAVGCAYMAYVLSVVVSWPLHKLCFLFLRPVIKATGSGAVATPREFMERFQNAMATVQARSSNGGGKPN
jgi:hypothetical protein